jgi:hypothetical protein
MLYIGPVLVSLLVVLATAAPALAAQVQQGDTLVIGPGQVVSDDVYAAGSDVQILGTVNGDVFAAGNSVTVAGTVTGGVFAVGNNVSVTGEVQHGVHAAGNTISISGPVAQDVVVAGSTFNAAAAGVIGRDLLLATGTAIVNAPVGRNIQVASGNVTLTAPVGGDVQAQVSNLHLTDSAHVAGTLTYTSNNEAVIAPGATVGAGIQHVLPQAQVAPASSGVSAGWAVVGWLRGLVGLAMIGLLFVFLLPRFSEKTVEIGRTTFWTSFGLGLALLIGVPIAAVVLFILGIMLGGWMLAFALLAIYAMVCATGAAFAAMLTGRLVVEALRQPQQHLAWNLLEGLALLGVIGLLPVVGGVVLVLACVIGIGALALSIAQAYRGSRAPTGALTPAPAPMEPHLAAA